MPVAPTTPTRYCFISQHSFPHPAARQGLRYRRLSRHGPRTFASFQFYAAKGPAAPAQGTAKTEQPAFLPPVLQCTRPHRRKNGGTGRKHLHSDNKKTGLKTGKICNIIGYCTVCTALHLPDSAPLSCGEEGDSFEPFGFETRQTVCRTACLRRNFPFMPGPAAWQPARNYS